MRIEPRDGEAWPGYTRRVAAFYRIDYVSLMRPLSDQKAWLNRLRVTAGQPLRLAGVAATPQTNERFATYFNLTNAEVDDMHLVAYEGIAVTLDPKHFSDYDPLHTRAEGTPARWSLPADVGWVRPRSNSVQCPDCVRADPLRHELSWWLALHLVCPEHACFLTAPGEPRTPYEDPRGLVAQAALLDTVKGDRVLLHLSRHQTYRQVVAVIETLAAVRLNSTPAQVTQLPPHILITLLRDAWDAVTQPLGTGPSAHLEELLATQRGRIKLNKAMAQHDCDGTGVAQVVRGASFMRLPDATHEPNSFAPTTSPAGHHPSHRIRRLPHLMPRHLYDGALSDLLHDTAMPQGRAAVILASIMHLTGASLRHASGMVSNCDSTPIRTLARIWARLQAEGRDEAFWSAVQHAAEQLASDDIDYRYREQLVLRTPLATRLATTTGLHEDAVTAWLSHEWACANKLLATVPFYAAKSRPGYAQRVDIKHSPSLRAALEKATAERATA